MKLLLISLVIVLTSTVYAGEKSDNLNNAIAYMRGAEQSGTVFHSTASSSMSQMYALLAIIEQNKEIIELLKSRR